MRKLFRYWFYWWQNKCFGSGAIRLSFDECYQRFTGSFARPVYISRSWCSDPENSVSDDVEQIEYEIDEFDGFKNMIKTFQQDLKISKKDFVIFYATCNAL